MPTCQMALRHIPQDGKRGYIIISDFFLNKLCKNAPATASRWLCSESYWGHIEGNRNRTSWELCGHQKRKTSHAVAFKKACACRDFFSYYPESQQVTSRGWGDFQRRAFSWQYLLQLTYHPIWQQCLGKIQSRGGLWAAPMVRGRGALEIRVEISTLHLQFTCDLPSLLHPSLSLVFW